MLINSNKLRVLYILGSSFSGTTLFSLALGTHNALLNLGEVSSLEHDYNDRRFCTCGQVLNKCPFWSYLKQWLEINQNNVIKQLRWCLKDDGAVEYLDRRYNIRSLKENCKIFFGVPLSGIFPRNYLEMYGEKNKLFFHSVSKAFPDYKYIIDCSKQPERLEAIKQNRGIDVRVIYLKRESHAIFASSLKRLRVRNRGALSRYANSFSGSLIYALWLRSVMRRCDKVFSTVASEDRLIVSFEKFVKKPHVIVQRVINWLGLNEVGDEALKDLIVRPSEQHIYVGNRWLFKNPNEPVHFKYRDDIDKVRPSQKLAMHLVFNKKQY